MHGDLNELSLYVRIRRRDVGGGYAIGPRCVDCVLVDRARGYAVVFVLTVRYTISRIAQVPNSPVTKGNP